MRSCLMVLLLAIMGVASALENKVDKVDEGEVIFARSVFLSVDPRPVQAARDRAGMPAAD